MINDTDNSNNSSDLNNDDGDYDNNNKVNNTRVSKHNSSNGGAVAVGSIMSGEGGTGGQEVLSIVTRSRVRQTIMYAMLTHTKNVEIAVA